MLFQIFFLNFRNLLLILWFHSYLKKFQPKGELTAPFSWGLFEFRISICDLAERRVVLLPRLADGDGSWHELRTEEGAEVFTSPVGGEFLWARSRADAEFCWWGEGCVWICCWFGPVVLLGVEVFVVTSPLCLGEESGYRDFTCGQSFLLRRRDIFTKCHLEELLADRKKCGSGDGVFPRVRKTTSPKINFNSHESEN